MSDFQHAVIGGTILMIIWFGFVKDFFKSEKDEQSWEEWKDLLRRFW